MSPSLVNSSRSSMADVCKIRPYKDTDEEDVMEICRITAHEKAQAEPVRTVVPYVFALPYVRIHPEYCWVVDDGSGKAVGYIVAVPDSKEYLRRVKEEYLPMFKRDILPDLDDSHPGLFASPFAEDIDGGSMLDAPMSPGNEIERIGKAGSPREVAAGLVQRFWRPDDSILHSAWPDLLKEYPCHLHIDILPAFEKKGLGSRLMEKLKRKLREQGIKGMHLMKAGDNPGTTIFYEKVGFERYPFPMGGSDTELGVKKGGGICMVQKIDEEKK